MARRPRTLVILSYGLGWDSTAILVRWLLDPSSRDCDLRDLIVVTAMTGDEFKSMGVLVEKYILPLMRAHGVRFVQVARGGASTRAGVTILDDSRSPTKVYLDGVYKLSDEMLESATVPQFGGARLCSQKQKGVPLDFIIDKLTKGKPFRHVMGFNADELNRVARDASYSTVTRKSEYPLVTWGWGRAKLSEYVRESLGVEWEKSCCTFCPFAGSCKAEKMEALTSRYTAEPEAAVLALTIERRSLAMNVRQPLFAKTSLFDVLAQTDPALVALFEKDWNSAKAWSLYRVRRSFRGVGQAVRSLECIATGPKARMLARQASFGEVEHTAGSPRVFVQRKVEDVFPVNEDMYVVAPAGVAPKTNAMFDAYWVRTGEVEAARATGADEPCPKARAMSFVLRYVVTHAANTFTKGDVQRAAGASGVFTKEAGAAYDELKAEGRFGKVGKRMTLAPAAWGSVEASPA